MKGWLRPNHGAEYADVSVRTYRDWLRSGLRSIRVKGIVLTKVEWIDEFLEKHEVGSGREIDRIVSETLKDMNL